jgi:hypothetical protein
VVRTDAAKNHNVQLTGKPNVDYKKLSVNSFAQPTDEPIKSEIRISGKNLDVSQDEDLPHCTAIKDLLRPSEKRPAWNVYHLYRGWFDVFFGDIEFTPRPVLTFASTPDGATGLKKGDQLPPIRISCPIREWNLEIRGAVVIGKSELAEGGFFMVVGFKEKEDREKKLNQSGIALRYKPESVVRTASKGDNSPKSVNLEVPKNKHTPPSWLKRLTKHLEPEGVGFSVKKDSRRHFKLRVNDEIVACHHFWFNGDHTHKTFDLEVVVTDPDMWHFTQKPLTVRVSALEDMACIFGATYTACKPTVYVKAAHDLPLGHMAVCLKATSIKPHPWVKKS